MGRQTEQTSFTRRNNCSMKVSYGTKQCFGHRAATSCSQPCEDRASLLPVLSNPTTPPSPSPSLPGLFLSVCSVGLQAGQYCHLLLELLLSPPFSPLVPWFFFCTFFLLFVLLKSRGGPVYGIWVHIPFFLFCNHSHSYVRSSPQLPT